jgi:hypothetical protein
MALLIILLILIMIGTWDQYQRTRDQDRREAWENLVELEKTKPGQFSAVTGRRNLTVNPHDQVWGPYPRVINYGKFEMYVDRTSFRYVNGELLPDPPAYCNICGDPLVEIIMDGGLRLRKCSRISQRTGPCPGKRYLWAYHPHTGDRRYWREWP